MIIKYIQSNCNATKKETDDLTITAAENALGLHFADEYRNVLREYGHLSFGSHDFNGISEFEIFDVVKQTLIFREKSNTIADTMYVVEDLGIDGIYILQDSDGLVYAAQAKGTPYKVADSLLEYIKKAATNG